MKTFVSGRPYWWQWLTILSLDAPAVAVTWQALLGHVAGITLRPVHCWVLGSSVWCAYTADRWIEGWRLLPEKTLTQRHYFSARWRWPIFVIGWIVLTSDLTVAILYLNKREFYFGLMLLIPVLLYLFSHQFLHRRHSWRVPKEICIAALIAGGVIVFVLAQSGVNHARLISVDSGFGLLCFTNCALISLWEREVDESQDQDSLAKRSGRTARAVRLMPWLIVSASAMCWTFSSSGSWLRSAFACLGSSGALLGLVDGLERWMGRQLARVLSDAVLLTPLVLLIDLKR